MISDQNFLLIWQTYVSNNEKIVHLRPRTSSKEFKLTKRSKFNNVCSEFNAKESKVATPPKWGAICEECGKHLQDERNRFCSITCKVTPYLNSMWSLLFTS